MAEKAACILKRVTFASLYILIYFAMQMILGTASAYSMENADSSLGVLMVLAMISAYLIYRVSFYVRGMKVRDEYTMSRLGFLDILFAIALAIGFRVITSAYFVWAEQIKVLTDSLENAPNFDVESMSIFSQFWYLAAADVAGPVFEEILFRGIVMTELRKIMPAAWAIVIQGIVFGFFHMLLIQGIFAAVFGIILGFIYYKTKKLSVTAAVHIIFNMSAVLQLRDDMYVMTAGLVGSLITAAAIGMFIYLYRHKDELI